jgi:hypothetical protein
LPKKKKNKAADDFSLSISNIEVDKCENFKERFKEFL